MPENNKSGAPYQGHFACIGRWGRPSPAEIKAGVPDHGHFANMLWKEKECVNERVLAMSAISELEGLSIRRSIQMDAVYPVVAVEEEIQNIRPLGRLFNIVQHPTLAAPFLDSKLIVDCNAAIGFNQAFSDNAEDYAMRWPFGYFPMSLPIDLRSPAVPYNSLYSFVVENNSKHGWITAFSPTYNAVLGYVWNRSEYPWIHLWQDWNGSFIRYRAVEFGTAAYHKPFNEITRHPPRLFGEEISGYIDAKEKLVKRFLCFFIKVDDGFGGVKNIEVTDGRINIAARDPGSRIEVCTDLTGVLANQVV